MKISQIYQQKLGLSLLLIFVIVFGVVSLRLSKKNFDKTETLYEQALLGERSISMLYRSIYGLHRDMKDLSLDTTEAEIGIEIDWINWWKFRASGQIDTIYTVYSGQRKDIDSLKKDYETLIAICGNTIELMKSKRKNEVLIRTKTNGIISMRVQKVLAKLDNINKITISKDDELYSNIVLLRNSYKNGMLIFIIITFLFTFIINLILTRINNRRKQIEELLRESEEQIRAIFDSSKDAIGIAHKGICVMINNAYVDMFGYENQNEIIGKSLLEQISPKEHERVQQYFSKRYLAQEVPTYYESIGIRKNGDEFPFEVNAGTAIIKNEIYSIAIIRDITERNQIKNELIKAKEKAEESDRLKSAFLANMSHEIRTPMNGILGFAELLQEPNLTSDELQDFIQTIQISGARMLNTINSIVDVSKIESGLAKIDIKQTNMNEKLDFTYKFFKPEVENKGLKFILKTRLPADEAIINTDYEKVYGILTNLIKNAIKFTYVGSIEFGCEKKGESLEFFVKDTGVGIPQNQQQVIFERFRQGSESHIRGYEGSGLGLSISKSYVEMLGGEIWVESGTGIGSAFYFTIPYNTLSEEKIELKLAVTAERKETELKNLKILIVEDDEISYSLLTRILQKISKEVLHVVTGVEAVEACRENPDLDLVLMDIRMAKMDGNEATRQIRQFNKVVIIIAQTAFGYSGDKESALEAGCNDYISKPISMTLLLELIKKHINKK